MSTFKSMVYTALSSAIVLTAAVGCASLPERRVILVNQSGRTIETAYASSAWRGPGGVGVDSLDLEPLHTGQIREVLWNVDGFVLGFMGYAMAVWKHSHVCGTQRRCQEDLLFADVSKVPPERAVVVTIGRSEAIVEPDLALLRVRNGMERAIIDLERVDPDGRTPLDLGTPLQPGQTRALVVTQGSFRLAAKLVGGGTQEGSDEQLVMAGDVAEAVVRPLRGVLVIENERRSAVSGLWARASGEEAWGPNLLVDALPPADLSTLELDAGSYTIKVAFEDGVERELPAVLTVTPALDAELRLSD